LTIATRVIPRIENTSHLPEVPPGTKHKCVPAGFLGMHCYHCDRRMFHQVTPSDGSRAAPTSTPPNEGSEITDQPAMQQPCRKDLERELRHLQRKLREYANHSYRQSYVHEIIEKLIFTQDRVLSLLQEVAV